MIIKDVSSIIKDCGGTDAVASTLNVSLYTISDWIKDNTIPPKHWRKLVDAFGVDINILLGLSK